jgi:preprotein translocase subunit SecB
MTDISKDQTQDLLKLCLPVVKQVQIDDLYLSRSTIQRNEEQKEVPTEVDIGYRFKVESAIDREAKRINVVVILTISGKSEDQKGQIFEIQSAFSISYSLRSTEGIEEVNVNAFGKMNAVHNVWPFWREYVQSSLSRMGLPTVTLPVLTSQMLKKMYEEQDSTDVGGQAKAVVENSTRD